MRFLFALLCFYIISCTKNNISTDIEIPTTKKNDTLAQTIELEKGTVLKLNGSVQFSNGETTKDVTWESLSPDIVKIENDGKVTALKEGNSKLKIIANKDKTKFSIIEITVVAVKNSDVQISTGNKSKFLNDLDPNLFNQTTSNNSTKSPTPSSSPDIKVNYEKTNLTVYVYDINGNLLDGASITVKDLDKNISFNTNSNSNNGIAIFKNVPINTVLSISVSKIGYNTKERTEVLKSRNEARIDFGGNTENEAYALQQEPEISKITVNKKLLTDFTLNSTLAMPNGTEKPNVILTNDSSINIDLYFSKTVNRESVENSIQVISQATKNYPNGILFTKDNKNLYFSWSYNDSSVSVLFGNNYDNLTSIIYKLKVIQPFYDKSNIFSLKNKSINFNNSQKSDCLIIKNNKP